MSRIKWEQVAPCADVCLAEPVYLRGLEAVEALTQQGTTPRATSHYNNPLQCVDSSKFQLNQTLAQTRGRSRQKTTADDAPFPKIKEEEENVVGGRERTRSS